MAKKLKRAESRCRYYVRQEAEKRGWNLRHPDKGGQLLEEQEIAAAFPALELGGARPDFLFCLNGAPTIVVETKNEPGKLAVALAEAKNYVDIINQAGVFHVVIAVGAAGDEDSGFEITTHILTSQGWQPLIANKFELTNFPSTRETELALAAGDGSTDVSIPTSAEFIDSAVAISQVFRLARIEAPLRPKVIGTLVLALYQGGLRQAQMSDSALALINDRINEAIDHAGLDEINRIRLKEVLHLSEPDFRRLVPYLGRIIALLNQLNVRSVIHTDADFLGMFYEAFLRYGYDNNALGIVFTPRHITRMCVDLLGTDYRDRVIDIACGTGGFLVSAFEAMLTSAPSQAAREKAKSALTGFDTNPTVWALAVLNMFFRGDGKNHIANDSCFDDQKFVPIEGKFTHAFLNPPFSQTEEPERLFIDRALSALEPGGLLAVVVKAGIFADDEHRQWRKQFLKKHTPLAVISLPEDLFYPTAAPTSILIAQAHVPAVESSHMLLGRVWNDGYSKLKGKRVAHPGNQIPDILSAWRTFQSGGLINSPLVTTRPVLTLSNGEEWSPQEWLPQPTTTDNTPIDQQDAVIRAVFQATVTFPDLTDSALEPFPLHIRHNQLLPPLPYGETGTVADFFTIRNGRSIGEKHYNEGSVPYISSGDATNSIIRLVEADASEIFPHGGLTITAFGQAAVQPWPFVARGNGGSSVRVLIPNYYMSLPELTWFAAQINAQRWRFFYARMAIRGRLMRLQLAAPLTALPDHETPLRERMLKLRQTFNEISTL